MDAVFKKLNFKNHQRVFILNAPTSFEQNVASISGEAEIRRKVEEGDTIDFVIGFATKQTEVDDIADLVGPRLNGDAVIWLCYPKGSSKKYQCDFNRDSGWTLLGKYGLEGVRQVAIDQDWSALRFRNVKYIKHFKRRKSMALSKEGKSRASKK